MSGFFSKLAPSIETFIEYRTALGYSGRAYRHTFLSIDRFFAERYPEENCLTGAAVMDWLDGQSNDIQRKASAIRMLGKYMSAIGKESYVLPTKTIRGLHEAQSQPYLFTDAELTALFRAADTAPATKAEPFLNEMAPVLFRLTYTCGLRPGEGRELECRNINLKTGEILIVNAKYKKDRLVVMSEDMLGLCRAYDARRTVFAKGSPFFFPAWSGGTLSRGKVASCFRDCWMRAYPDTPDLPSVRVYDLRHRFASAVLNRWLDAGQNLYVKLPYLRAYMGHAHLNETLYYVHLLPENLVKSPGIDWDAFDGMMPEVTVCPE